MSSAQPYSSDPVELVCELAADFAGVPVTVQVWVPRADAELARRAARRWIGDRPQVRWPRPRVDDELAAAARPLVDTRRPRPEAASGAGITVGADPYALTEARRCVACLPEAPGCMPAKACTCPPGTSKHYCELRVCTVCRGRGVIGGQDFPPPQPAGQNEPRGVTAHEPGQRAPGDLDEPYSTDFGSGEPVTAAADSPGAK
jgi:hypothetical protein